MRQESLFPDMAKSSKARTKLPVPGMALTRIEDESPLVEGKPVVLASPPPSSHLPAMTISSATEYAHLATEQLRKSMADLYAHEGVLVMPSEEGEWIDMIRVAVLQAVQDGYCLLKSGVPVAIRADAKLIQLNTES